MSRLLGSRRLSLLVLAVAFLPWLVASRIGAWGTGTAPILSGESAVIHALSSVVVVTADRPKGSSHAKRGDGLRLSSSAPSFGAHVGPAWAFIGFELGSASRALLDPVALDLAGRGPPSPLVQ